MEVTWTESRARAYLPTVQVDWNGIVHPAKVSGQFSPFASVSFVFDYNGRRIPVTYQWSWQAICHSLNNHTPLVA